MNIIDYIKDINLTDEDRSFVERISSIKDVRGYIDFKFGDYPVIDFFKRNEHDKILALYFVDFMCDYGTFRDYIDKSDNPKLQETLLNIAAENGFEKVLDLTLSETLIRRTENMLYFIVRDTSIETISKWAIQYEFVNEEHAVEDTKELLVQNTISVYEHSDKTGIIVVPN